MGNEHDKNQNNSTNNTDEGVWLKDSSNSDVHQNHNHNSSNSLTIHTHNHKLTLNNQTITTPVSQNTENSNEMSSNNSDTATTNTTPIAQPRLNQISGQSSDLHSHSIPEDLEVERIMTSYRQQHNNNNHHNKPILPKSSTLMIPHNNQNYSRNLPNSTSMNCSATYIRPQITSVPQKSGAVDARHEFSFTNGTIVTTHYNMRPIIKTNNNNFQSSSIRNQSKPNLTSNSQPIIENSSRNILHTFDKKNSRFERGVPKIDLSSGGITIVNESVDNL